MGELDRVLLTYLEVQTRSGDTPKNPIVIRDEPPKRRLSGTDHQRRVRIRPTTPPGRVSITPKPAELRTIFNILGSFMRSLHNSEERCLEAFSYHQIQDAIPSTELALYWLEIAIYRKFASLAKMIIFSKVIKASSLQDLLETAADKKPLRHS